MVAPKNDIAGDARSGDKNTGLAPTSSLASQFRLEPLRPFRAFAACSTSPTTHHAPRMTTLLERTLAALLLIGALLWGASTLAPENDATPTDANAPPTARPPPPNTNAPPHPDNDEEDETHSDEESEADDE